MIRQGTGMPVSRFCVLLGIPRRTYCRMQSRCKAGVPTVKGPWPAPSVEAVEAVVEEYVLAYPDYGHRRIHALALADGHATSPSTVLRAMRRLRQCQRDAGAGVRRLAVS
jgi:putative transposase